jgi:putative transposase
MIVARQLKHEDVLAALAELFIARGPPANIRSDNGSEFIARTVSSASASRPASTVSAISSSASLTYQAVPGHRRTV